jgi:hypothetical protein
MGLSRDWNLQYCLDMALNDKSIENVSKVLFVEKATAEGNGIHDDFREVYRGNIWGQGTI